MGSEGGLSREDDSLGGAAGVYREDDSCPAFDIRLMVEPLPMAQAAIKCTQEELSQAAASQTAHFDFGWESQIISQDIVLRSDELRNDAGSFTPQGKPHTVVKRDYQIRITQPGSALSIVATFPFAEM